MDTVISKEVVRKRKRKSILIAFAVVVMIIASVMVLRASFSSTIKRQNITTAGVEIGTIEK